MYCSVKVFDPTLSSRSLEPIRSTAKASAVAP
jgi:hypothetical protein